MIPVTFKVASLALVSLATSAASECPDWQLLQRPAGSGFYYLRDAVQWDRDGAGPNPPTLAVIGHRDQPLGEERIEVWYWEGQSWRGMPALGYGTTTTAIVTADLDGDGGVPPRLFAAYDSPETNTSIVVQSNGDAWEQLGDEFASAPPQFSCQVRVLFPWHQPGEQTRLVAAGFFLRSGNQILNSLGVWNGAAWMPLGNGVFMTDRSHDPWSESAYGIHAITQVDLDGDGPNVATLTIGGRFPSFGGVAFNHVAQWTGQMWQALGNGVGFEYVYDPNDPAGIVRSMTSWDPDGSGPQTTKLVVAGQFELADNLRASLIAQWDGSAWSSLPDTSREGEPRVGTQYYDLAQTFISPQGNLAILSGTTEQSGFSNVAELVNGRWQGIGSAISDWIYGGGSRRVLRFPTADNPFGLLQVVQVTSGPSRGAIYQLQADVPTIWPHSFQPFETSLNAPDVTISAPVTPAATSISWSRNGRPLRDGPMPSGANISGANTARLRIQRPQLGDAGVYTINVSKTCGQVATRDVTLIVRRLCRSLDFNRDGLFPSDQDLLEFLAVFSGQPCTPGYVCDSLDFNNDGQSPDDQDLRLYIEVLAGGPCQ